MAKVELSYNPYLLDTRVVFNGKRPRINSLVEKYMCGSLYSWIDDMPQILHDEMNGYGFQLDFSGTDRDYEAIKHSFGDNDVEIFHKNRMDGRYEKNAAIDEMLAWLGDNRNHQFDYEAFRTENTELFDSAYPFIILNGGKIDETLFEGLNVSADNIDSLDAIEDADLMNVPVLVCIDKDSISKLEHNIEILNKRRDILPRQLFFLIHPALSNKRVERILRDMGINSPQIINSNDITPIREYMELFPITQYIREVVKLFGTTCEDIHSGLKQKLIDNEITGKDTRDKIEVLDGRIEALKRSYDRLLNRDNLDMPAVSREAREYLRNQIKNWRKRKTKITKDEDATKYAKEYERDIRSYFDVFEDKIDSMFELQRSILRKTNLKTYREAGIDVDYVPNVGYEVDSDVRISVPLFTDFTRLKHEAYVQQEDIFDSFFSSNNDIELVREVTYYNQEWRDYAEKAVMPEAKKYVESRFNRLCQWEAAFADDLLKHLEQLIDEESKNKRTVVNQMSETEKELQEDADWIGTLEGMLEAIMRG